jgi:branched-chain amino acid transport system ATP-binding protein
MNDRGHLYQVLDPWFGGWRSLYGLLAQGLVSIYRGFLFDAVRGAADNGLGVLLVEQRARTVLPYCDRAYVLRRGQIVMDTSGDNILSREDEVEAHSLGDGG